MKTASALLGTAVVAAAVATLVTLKAAPRGPAAPAAPVARGERPGERARAVTAPAPRLQLPVPEIAGAATAAEPGMTFNEADLAVDEARVLMVLEGKVEREQRDPTWAPAFEDEIRKRLNGRPSERIVEVSCRSTLCRVELEHQASGQREQFVNQMPEVMPPGLVMHLQKLDRDGRTLSVVHLFREGHQPPPIM